METQDRKRPGLGRSFRELGRLRWVQLCGLFTLTFGIYLILAPLGRLTVFPEAGLSLMWLPTAFGVGMLARVSRRNQPIVAAGIALAEATADLLIFKFPVSTTPLFVIANLGEQFLVAEILRRFNATRLRRSRDVVVLFLAAAIGEMAGATLGAVAGVLTFGASYPEAWRAWYLGGLTATVVIAPFVLTVHRPRNVTVVRFIEFTVALGLVIAVSLATFMSPTPTGRLGFIAVIAPLLGWLGFRFGILGVSTASPLIIYIGTISATNSLGPFTGRTPTVSDLLTTQLLLVMSAVTIYCAAAVEEARRVAAEESRLASEQLRFQATHDAVTGLANRYALVEQIQRSHETRGGAKAGSMTVLFIDLDGFKQVNDRHGHQDGDFVLGAIGERLRLLLPEAVSVARIGGDEFVVVLRGLESTSAVEAAATMVRTAIAAPITSTHRDFIVGACIGVATAWPTLTGELNPDATPDELIRRADVALNDAKQHGPNRTCTYSSELDAAMHRRGQVKELLTEGLDRGWVRAWGQPIYNAVTAEVAGTEVLARLELPTGEIISPVEFIPIAESTGLVVELGTQMLAAGLRELAAGFVPAISVNASARELADPMFAERTLAAIAEHKVGVGGVTIEVTETALIDSGGQPERQLETLRAGGVKVALDDFGTGYSSLTFLRNMPHDIVKIDRQFISNIETSADDLRIAKALIDVTHDLGKAVVAEGVEDGSQLATLKSLNCDFVQGFLFAKPAPLRAQQPSMPQQRTVNTHVGDAHDSDGFATQITSGR